MRPLFYSLLLAAAALSGTAADTPELVVRSGHTGAINAVAFTPDGRTILSAGADGSIRFWDSVNGAYLRRIGGHVGPIHDLAVCPDGSAIATTGADGALRLWSFDTGRKLAESAADPQANLAWLGDCRQLALSTAGAVAVLDLAKPAAEPRRLPLPEALTALRYLPRFHLLVGATGYSQSLLAWDTETWNALPRVPTAAEDRPDFLLAGAAGNFLTSFTARSLTTIDVRTRQPLHRSDRFSLLSAASMTADGSQVWTADDGKIAAWSVPDLAKTAEFDLGNIGPTAAAISPDGRYFAVGGVSGDIAVFDLAEKRRVLAFPGGGAIIGSIQFTALDGLRVFGAAGGAGRIWDIGAIDGVQDLGGGLLNLLDVRAAAAGGDGSYLVTSAPLQLTWWDLGPAPAPHQVATHTINGWPIACVGAGRCAWEENGPGSNSIAIGNVRSGETPRQLPIQSESAVALALSPDGRWLAAATNQSHVRLWSVGDGVERAALPLEKGSPGGPLLARLAAGKLFVTDNDMGTALAFSPDGKWLAAGNGKAVELWDVATWQVRKRFETGAEPTALAFEGGKLACALDGSGIRIWNVAGDSPEIRLENSSETIVELAFRPNSQILAAASESRVVLWDITARSLLATIDFTSAGWIAATPGGAFDASERAWESAAWRTEGHTRSLAPVETYVRDYFTPGLIADVLAGRPPETRKQFLALDRNLPRVRLEKLEEFQPGAPSLKVRVHVDSTASEAFDLKIYRNGELIRRVDGPLGKAFARDFEIPVPAGNNEIAAAAFNGDGLRSPADRLVLAETRSMYQAPPVTLRVLAVGINRYAEHSLELHFARQDAQAVAEALNFSMEDLRKSKPAATNQTRFSSTPSTMAWKTEIQVLADEQATRDGILSALRRLAAASGPSDALVFYYAGHSVTAGGRFYLIPQDGKLNAGGAAPAGGISDGDLESALDGVDAAHIALILDSCYSGKVVDARDRRGPLDARGLARLSYDKGMWVLAASQSEEEAREETGLGHGLLTYALVEEGMRQWRADAAKTGSIELGAWLSYAARRVPELDLEDRRDPTRGGKHPPRTGSALPRQIPQFIPSQLPVREELILRVRTVSDQ